MMAIDACCACGGGDKVSLPTPAPVENVCTDTPGWYGKCLYQGNHSLTIVRVFSLNHKNYFPCLCISTDKDGEPFGCSWYANGDNCQKYGFDLSTANFGETAGKFSCFSIEYVLFIL